MDVVTPFETSCGQSGFEYEKLIEQFGVSPINEQLIKRFEKVTGHTIHPWIRRGIFFAHRELDLILNDYEQGKPIFIYTGRGPSSQSLHLGHMIPFMITKWLQEVFSANVVIQIADDEKYYFKDMDFDTIKKLGDENIKDIIACGFDPDKTFIFSSREYNMYPAAHEIIHEMFKKINVLTLQKTFGLTETDNLGKYISPIYQTAAAMWRFYGPMFKENTRCLVTYAIDQDPYFRIARDVSKSVGSYKPCALISKFLPALEGCQKMSSTSSNTDTKPTHPIFMSYNAKQIRKTINKHAFSGGKVNLEEHREYGADLSVDMTFHYLHYFEYDDDKLKEIEEAYGSGKMTSGEIKKILADKVIEFVEEHQNKRKNITNDCLNKYLHY